MPETREEWLVARQHSIGASEAASALGLNPWKSAYQLWAEKTGLITPANLDQNEAVIWGKRLEEPIAQHYQQVTGRKVVNLGDFFVQRHPDLPFLTCTLDRQIEAANGTPEGALEIKTAGVRAAEDWESEPPLHYQVQLHQQLLVTGMTWGSLAVLIAGQKFLYSDHQRREDFERWLIQRLQEFWQHVQDRTPPPVDASNSTRETLHRIFPREVEGPAITLPAEAIVWTAGLDEIKEQIKALDARKTLLENQIKSSIGEAARGILPDGSAAYSWKVTHKAAYQVAEQDVRILRKVKV